MRPVVFVPGGMNPAVVTYGDLLPHLSYEIDPLLKDHELYRAARPPPGWTLSTEVEAILRAADERRFRTFDLVGYSGGGGISLKLVELHPDRVASLALIEPAWIGNRVKGPEQVRATKAFEHSVTLPPDQFFPAFMEAALKPGVPLPPRPEGPPPSWMRKRPAGFAAFVRAFREDEIDEAAFGRFRAPVYVAYGDLSDASEEEKAKSLSKRFSNARIEEYKGTHHFDPPHRKEPERFASALRALWARAP